MCVKTGETTNHSTCTRVSGAGSGCRRCCPINVLLLNYYCCYYYYSYSYYYYYDCFYCMGIMEKKMETIGIIGLYCILFGDTMGSLQLRSS